MIRHGKREARDDDVRQRRPRHVHALPEAVHAEQDRAGGGPEPFEQLRTRQVATLAQQRQALRDAPVLQPSLEAGRADVLRGDEVVGDDDDLRGVEHPLDAHPFERLDRHRAGDVVGQHEVAGEHDDVAGRDVVHARVLEDDLLGRGVAHGQAMT